MPGQLTLGGALTGGPPNGADLASGRSLINIVLALKGGASAKPYGAATGILSRTVNSQSLFRLSGVGDGDTVTKGDTLYFFVSGQVDVELITDDGQGGNVTADFTPDGIVLLEFNQLKFLKEIQVKGVGVIEYFVSGPV